MGGNTLNNSTMNRSVSAATGEYLALGEILKRGIEAYLAHGQTQKCWDIVVLSASNGVKRIQVKTIDWPSKRAVNGNFIEGFDFLVVVLLDRENPRSQFLVLPVTDLNSLISAPSETRKNKARTLTISNTAMENSLKKYKDQWEQISNPAVHTGAAQ